MNNKEIIMSEHKRAVKKGLYKTSALLMTLLIKGNVIVRRDSDEANALWHLLYSLLRDVSTREGTSFYLN